MMYSYCEICVSFGNNTGAVLLFVYTTHMETLKDYSNFKKTQGEKKYTRKLETWGNWCVDCSTTVDGRPIIVMYTNTLSMTDSVSITRYCNALTQDGVEINSLEPTFDKLTENLFGNVNGKNIKNCVKIFACQCRVISLN